MRNKFNLLYISVSQLLLEKSVSYIMSLLMHPVSYLHKRIIYIWLIV